MSHIVFHFTAEKLEKPYVTQEMETSVLEKNGCHESLIIKARTTMSSIVVSGKFCRDNPQQLNQMLERFGRQCSSK